MSGRPDHETDDVLRAAEAAARRSDDDVALLLADVERAAAVVAQGRAELEAARDDDARLAREDAERARSGELGPARRVVQQRIDRDETTWAAVMGDLDQHWSAVEVRAQLVTELRHAIDVLEEEDPEFSELYRSAATGRDPAERPGEWDSLGPPGSGAPPPPPPAAPPTQGTW